MRNHIIGGLVIAAAYLSVDGMLRDSHERSRRELETSVYEEERRMRHAKEIEDQGLHLAEVDPTTVYNTAEYLAYAPRGCSFLRERLPESCLALHEDAEALIPGMIRSLDVNKDGVITGNETVTALGGLPVRGD